MTCLRELQRSWSDGPAALASSTSRTGQLAPLILSLLMTLATATACSTKSTPTTVGTSSSSRAAVTQESGPLEGPLPGGTTLRGPKGLGPRHLWVGTFGTQVCLEPSTERAILRSVRYHASAPPLSVKTFARFDGTSPLISILGDPRGQEVLDGHISTRIKGTAIDNSCDNPEDWFEVLTVVKTASGGAELSRMGIVYTVGSHRYRLTVDWTFRLCGSRVPKKGCQD